MSIDPSLAVQRLIYARLTGSADLAELVPTANILDRNGRPEVFPSILIGEGHAIFPVRLGNYIDADAGVRIAVHADLHIWSEEPGLTTAKAIAWAIRQALAEWPWQAEGHRCHMLVVERQTFMRDPSGKCAHGVVSIQATLQEVAA